MPNSLRVSCSSEVSEVVSSSRIVSRTLHTPYVETRLDLMIANRWLHKRVKTSARRVVGDVIVCKIAAIVLVVTNTKYRTDRGVSRHTGTDCLQLALDLCRER